MGRPKVGASATTKERKIIMKTIAILAIAGAALVSCQQQQPDPTPVQEVIVAPVCK